MTREEAANILDPEIDIQYLFDFIREHYGKRGVDSALLCECVDAEACRMGAAALRELDEYKKAESEGRLVVPPCKVGDTVWIKGDKFPAEIEEIRITDDGIYFAYVEYDRGYEETEVWDNCEFTLSDIGKTVFLTREEAEKALEDCND